MYFSDHILCQKEVDRIQVPVMFGQILLLYGGRLGFQVHNL